MARLAGVNLNNNRIKDNSRHPHMARARSEQAEVVSLALHLASSPFLFAHSPSSSFPIAFGQPAAGGAFGTQPQQQQQPANPMFGSFGTTNNNPGAAATGNAFGNLFPLARPDLAC